MDYRTRIARGLRAIIFNEQRQLSPHHGRRLACPPRRPFHLAQFTGLLTWHGVVMSARVLPAMLIKQRNQRVHFVPHAHVTIDQFPVAVREKGLPVESVLAQPEEEHAATEKRLVVAVESPGQVRAI